MSVKTAAHLNFRGEARGALEFYRTVFGGDQLIVTYKDAGNIQDPSEADQVLWGQVTADSGFCVMAYDVPSRMPWSRGENSFFVSVRGSEAAEITTYWEKLSEGAAVLFPLAPSSWSALYGMLTDRFGITWVLDIEYASAAS